MCAGQSSGKIGKNVKENVILYSVHSVYSVLKSHLSKTSTISCPIKKNGKCEAKICERNNSVIANCSYFHIIQKYKIV